MSITSQALIGEKDKKSDDDAFIGGGEGDADSAQQKLQNLKLGGTPKIKQLVFEMRVKNQVIYAHPNVSMMMQVPIICQGKGSVFRLTNSEH